MLRARFDGTTLLILPGLAVMLGLFIYPFIYGLADSVMPKVGPWYANYVIFFSDPFQYRTIASTLWLALPVTIVNLAFAVPIAFRVRLMTRQRLLTTILVLPITLGTVFVADGLLTFLGPQGWFNRVLVLIGLLDAPMKLTNNYWGVFASLVITGFPFAFLLTLSYVTGIDPAIEQAAATLGANARQRFMKSLSAASGAGTCRHLLPGFRAGLCGLSLSRAARCSGRPDAGDLDCRLSSSLRAI